LDAGAAAGRAVRLWHPQSNPATFQTDRGSVESSIDGKVRMSLSFILVMFVLPAGIIAAAVTLARLTRERVG
jgi:hypothetical protein